jgi:hypothetical protein
MMTTMTLRPLLRARPRHAHALWRLHLMEGR